MCKTLEIVCSSSPISKREYQKSAVNEFIKSLVQSIGKGEGTAHIACSFLLALDHRKRLNSRERHDIQGSIFFTRAGRLYSKEWVFP